MTEQEKKVVEVTRTKILKLRDTIVKDDRTRVLQDIDKILWTLDILNS